MIKQCLWIPRLETKRLILRKLDMEDADDLQTWLWRPEVYTYWGTPLGKGEHDARKLFIDPRPHVKRKPSHDFIWGVELRESNKVIGILEVFDVVNDQIGTVGYRISPDLWNQGICTEAMRRVVDFIFTETTIQRLHAEADVENSGSNAVLRKAGFVYEGCIRQGRMGSRYCSYNIYGLLREDREQRACSQEGV